MTRKKNTEASAADERALLESLAKLNAEIDLVTYSLNCVKNMLPPRKARGKLERKGLP
jgi:hypothetical protein